MWKVGTAWYSVKPHYWVWLFLFVVFAIPGWFSYDMFLDGLTYGAISRNWAMGEGSFWFMHYTDHLYPRFVEHPPMYFLLQGSLFYVFGDYPWIEELFNSLLWLVLFITALQFVEQKENEAKWVMIAMMMLLPGVCWSFQNNMLESMLAVCYLYSVLSYTGKDGISAGVSGVWVGLALLVKGAFALPLLLIPILNYSSFSVKKAITFYGILAVICLILWTLPESQSFWMAYLDKQILGSLNEGWNIGDFVQRFLQLLGPWCAVGLALWMGIRKAWFSFNVRSQAKLLFLVAAVYAIPWLFTSKFNLHYFVVSHILLWIGVVQSIRVRSIVLPNWASTSVAILVLMLSFLIQPGERDAVRLAGTLDDHKKQEVTVSSELCDDWYLYAAVMRIASNSVRCSQDESALIVLKENQCNAAEKIGKYYLCKDEN